jgi:hypothetical protein
VAANCVKDLANLDALSSVLILLNYLVFPLPKRSIKKDAALLSMFFFFEVRLIFVFGPSYLSTAIDIRWLFIAAFDLIFILWLIPFASKNSTQATEIDIGFCSISCPYSQNQLGMPFYANI